MFSNLKDNSRKKAKTSKNKCHVKRVQMKTKSEKILELELKNIKNYIF